MASKRDHKILRLLSAGFLILVLAGAAFVFFMPERWLRSFAAGRGTAAFGREFAIDGDAGIQWSWTEPRVHLEKIRLANMPDSQFPDMLDIDRVDFRIRIWKLLTGELNLPDVRITRPRLILERTDQAHKNWNFPAFSMGGAVVDAALPDDRHDVPVIGQMTVTDGTILYRDAVKKLDLDLALNTASGSSGNKDAGVTLSGDGSLQGKPFTLDLTGGSIGMLRDTGKAYPLKLGISMGKTEISAEGTLNDPVRMTGIQTNLDISGDNLADLFYLTGIPLPPTPGYRLSGELVKQGKLWSYRNFKGKVGGSDLAGILKYDVSGARGFITIDLVSKLLDMNDLGGFIGVAPSTNAGRQDNGRILPDVPINLERLRAADMNVTLQAARVVAPGWPMNDMDAHAVLKDGVLTFDPIKFGIASGDITGKLVLDGTRDIPLVTADLSMKRLSLKQFFTATQFKALSEGFFGGRIDLAGSGRSLADVLATSNGRVTLIMSGGKISLLIIEEAGIDIAEALPLLLSEDKVTEIRCAVGDFRVADGILKSDIFVFDTVDTNVQGTATINLKYETINAKIEPEPKDNSPLSARTPILITGRLKNPDVGLDPAGLAARGVGAAILGALAPVAAIIPFIELGLGEDSNCQGLINHARSTSRSLVPAD